MGRRSATYTRQERLAPGGSGRFWAGVAVFALAAVVRFAFLAESSAAPMFSVPIVDAGTYDTVARNLISGQTPADIFWQPAFYPLWLAAIYKAGGGILAAKILQMLIGSLTCTIVFLLGDRFLGRKGGLLAGLGAAFYMPMVFLEAELLSTAWEGFWFVALAALSLKAKEARSPGLCFALGLCGGLAAVTRPNLIPVAAVWWLWLLWSWHKEKMGPKTLVLAACGAVGFAVLTVPVAAWSHGTHGRFSILPHSGGLNMYIGNNPDWEKSVMVRPGTDWRKLTELPLADGVKDKAGAERWFYAEVRKYVTSRPGSFLKGLGAKTVQFISSREIPRNVDIYQYRQWSNLLSLGTWKTGRFGFPFGLLFPLAAVGAWHWRRSLPPVLWVAAGMYAASVIVVFVAGRYRVPLAPFLCMPAAGGLLAIAQMARLRQWAGTTIALAAIFLIAAATSIAGPFPQEAADYRSEMHFELGNSLRDRGRLPDAEKAYARAIELRVDYADAHADLAGLLKDRGASLDAIRHYEAAIACGLDTGIVRAGLAEALIANGRYDEAITHLRQAVTLSPDNAKARNNLGNLLAMKGSHAEAIQQFEESLRLESGNARTMNNLANALAAVGRLPGAEEMYRKAIAAESTIAATHYHLAVCLRLQGKNAAAEAELLETLRLDPSHAGARNALRSLGGQRQ